MNNKDDDTVYIAKLKAAPRTWYAFSKYRWDRLDSSWDKRVAILAPVAIRGPEVSDGRDVK